MIKGQYVLLAHFDSPDGCVDLECECTHVENNIAIVYVHNGDWYGYLNLDTMMMNIQVPVMLRYPWKTNDKGKTYQDTTVEPDPNPVVHYKQVNTWEFKDGRCTLCGAKEKTHDTDHLCRMHKYDGYYLNVDCMVCNKPEKEVNEDWDDDIPF